jgi:hypothetical protein
VPILLHVGCGPNRKAHTTPGFNTSQWEELRFDIDASVEPDIIGTMTDMAVVADGSIDALFSSHNIEHLYPHEVPVALAEFRRVLRPEGFAVITCPDLRLIAGFVAQDMLEDTVMQSPAGPITPLDILFGHRPALAEGRLYMAHRTGFTLKTLIGALRSAGFGTVGGVEHQKTGALWVLASVQERAEADMKSMARDHLPDFAG